MLGGGGGIFIQAGSGLDIVWSWKEASINFSLRRDCGWKKKLYHWFPLQMHWIDWCRWVKLKINWKGFEKNHCKCGHVKNYMVQFLHTSECVAVHSHFVCFHLFSRKWGADNKMPTHWLKNKTNKKPPALCSLGCVPIWDLMEGVEMGRRDGQTIKCANIHSVH